LSRPVKKLKNYNYDYYTYNNQYSDIRVDKPKKRVKKRKSSKRNPILALVALSILGLYSFYVCPYNYNNYLRPLMLNRILNRNIKVDINPYIDPTVSYLHNSYLIDRYLLVDKTAKTKEFTKINMVSELDETKTKLLELFKKYPNLKPGVFVFEYSTGKGIDINANEIFPSASIIKIPIAFELMRLIDRTSNTKNPITLQDKRIFNEFFRTEGSGDLQYTKADTSYTIDYLANIMIAKSDNSATNMLLYEIGGLDGFNRAMRNLGLKTTSMKGWLPDLEGTNKLTPREIAEILYNIDNPYYINPKYKSVLQEYLGNTKNIHLLKEKLPGRALVLHKTGNIASMLGDSGIIYTDEGKKYIVSILVKRPANDITARNLIQDASLIIYNDINKKL